MRVWKSVCKSRVVFRTHLRISDGAFQQKKLMASSYFHRKLNHKCSTSEYPSEKTETFKMKLRLAKSSRLLQRTAFLVIFNISHAARELLQELAWYLGKHSRISQLKFLICKCSSIFIKRYSVSCLRKEQYSQVNQNDTHPQQSKTDFREVEICN